MQTVNERLRDESIAHAVWISRYSTGVAARMVKILNDSDAELTARLLIALDSLDPGSFTVKRLESLLASVREVTALDNTLVYTGVIDMPAGRGHMTLEFSVSAWLVNDWYPTASISDLLVVVMKKSTAGITIS